MSDTTERPAISDEAVERYFATRGAEVPTEPAERPATETTAEPAQPSATETQPKPASEPEAKVPLSALLEERRQRQQTAQQMQALREEVERLKNPKPADPKLPAFGEDPEKYVTGSVEQLRAEIKQMREVEENRQKQAAAEETYRQVIGGLKQAETAMAAKTPDYYQATEHIRAARVAELRAAGYSDQQIGQTIASDVFNLAVMALQQNRSPAEIAYEIAKARGYSPKKPESQENNASPEEQKLATIAEGQRFGASIQGQGGGGSSKREMTAADLARMSPDELDAWVEKNPAKWRKLAGA